MEMADISSTELQLEAVYPVEDPATLPASSKGNEFRCRICHSFIKDMRAVKRHIRSEGHSSKMQDSQLRGMLAYLPHPSPGQIKEVDRLLSDTYARNAAKACNQTSSRYYIVKILQSLIQRDLPDVKVELFGSTAYNCALTSSDVNINLNVGDIESNPSLQKRIPQIFMKVLQIVLHNSGTFTKVVEDFYTPTQIPSIRGVHVGSKLNCEIRAGSYAPVQLSSLLELYCSIDKRAEQLVVVFKFWARVVRADYQLNGHYASAMFALMVIHFLQQSTPPVLPVLDELVISVKECDDGEGGEESEGEGNEEEGEEEEQALAAPDLQQLAVAARDWKGNNQQSVGELWLSMLRYYVVDFNYSQHGITIHQSQPLLRKRRRGWGSSRLAVEDPIIRKSNMARAAGSDSVYDYLIGSLKKTLFYFLEMDWYLAHMQKDCATDEMGRKCIMSLKRLLQDDWKREEQETGRVQRKSKPEEEMKELAQTSSSELTVTSSSHDPVRKTLSRTSCESLSDANSPLPDLTIVGSLFPEEEKEEDLLFQEEREQRLVKDHIRHILHKAEETVKMDARRKEWSESSISLDKSTGDVSFEESSPGITEKDRTRGSCSQDSSPSLSVVEQDSKKTDAGQAVETAKIFYQCFSGLVSKVKLSHTPHFSLDNSQWLARSKDYPIACLLCKRARHSVLECPEDRVPMLQRDPGFPRYDCINAIDVIIHKYKNEVMLSPDEEKARARIRDVVVQDVRKVYPKADLALFGSSANGFGNFGSDLDLCLILNQETEDEKGEVIRKIATVIKSNRLYSNVCPITHARVPIVKFFIKGHCKMDCDISLDNLLALHNTKLLSTYAKYDSRVQVLGYAVKCFAKVCDMCDASTGSLSSYAYILMLLHFLQRTNPPVIPVLQQLPHDPHLRTSGPVIDSWNCHFFLPKSTYPRGIYEEVNRAWKSWPLNQMKAGYLWLQFLHYFAREFNWARDVVQIRQYEPITKFNKWWTNKPMCIEDPFNLDHNLAQAISCKMRTYILMRFQKAYLYHCKENIWRNIEQVMDRNVLCGGYNSPKFLLCDRCNKRGHRSAECPKSSGAVDSSRTKTKSTKSLKKATDMKENKPQQSHEDQPDGVLKSSHSRKKVYAVDEVKSAGQHRQALSTPGKNNSSMKNKELATDTAATTSSKSGRVQKQFSGTAERDVSVKKKKDPPAPAGVIAADAKPGRSSRKQKSVPVQVTSRPESVPLRLKPPQQSKSHSPQQEVTRRTTDKNMITQSPTLGEKRSRDVGVRSCATLAVSKSSQVSHQSQQGSFSDSKQIPVFPSRSVPPLPVSHSEHQVSKVSQQVPACQSPSASPSSQPALLPSPASYVMGAPGQLTGTGQAMTLHGFPVQDHARQPVTGLPFKEEKVWSQHQIVRKDSATTPISFSYAGLIGDPVFVSPGRFSQSSPSSRFSQPSPLGRFSQPSPSASSPLLSTSPSLTPPSPSSSQFAPQALQLQHWSPPWHPRPDFQVASPLLPTPGINPAMYSHWYGIPQANLPSPPLARTSSYPYTAWPTYQHVNPQLPLPPRK